MVAELAIGTGAGLAAAGRAGTARVRLRRTSAAFGDDPGPAADQPVHRAAALRAELDLGIGHLLAALKAASAGRAKIVVGGHSRIPLN